LGGRDSHIQVDAGIDAEKEMLEDDKMPTPGSPERGAPALAEVFAPMVTIKGIEVTIGKRHIEPFHARSVLEAPGEDSFVHFGS
jgi:hypothetical protein